MAKEKRQRVKFTGKRTGRESMPIRGLGIVERGQVIEVSEEEAEGWTAELPIGDDKFASDFVKVGGVYSLDEGEVAERKLMQMEKFLPDDPDEVLVNEASSEPAHPTADTGTAEKDAAKEAKEDGTKKDKKG